MNYVEAIRQELMDDGIDAGHANIYALLVLTTGVNTTLENVHDAWSVLKNTVRPDHRSLIPFWELSHEVQELDRKYMESIHRVARLIHPTQVASE